MCLMFCGINAFPKGPGRLFEGILIEPSNDTFGFGSKLHIQTVRSDEESSLHRRSLSLRAALMATFNATPVTLKSVGDVKVE